MRPSPRCVSSHSQLSLTASIGNSLSSHLRWLVLFSALLFVLSVQVAGAVDSGVATSRRADDPKSVEPVDFARQVLPILSNKCFVCHGPDSDAEVDLRLDSFAGATSDRGGYRAIDVENPDESELLTRIRSAEDPMPPQDAEKQLSDDERDLLERWVLQGGQYAKHWAFVRPEKERRFENLGLAIDHYVGQQLTATGIDFAPPADLATLARRVSLVLTGLPPEPAVLSRFLADRSEDAYERFVDRLLASPRFGEHQARYWLDAVRYGDTHGLHLDNRRGIYPYRDWVVRAMNDNVPMDKFITWQLAGDLLPNPTLDQRIATGYVRLNPSTGEGGAIPAEFQMKNNFDRVETLGTVFLGMSLTCARCHTHKYDPIEQTEYYRLLAFFNSTAEPAMDGNSYTYGPTARVPSNLAARQRWSEMRQSRDAILRDAAESIDHSAAVDYAAERTGWSTSHWQISKPIDRSLLSSDSVDGEVAGWQETRTFPGVLEGRAARNKLPGPDQCVLVRFDVEVERDQALDLFFSGATGSLVEVNDMVVGEKHADQSIDQTSIHQTSIHQTSIHQTSIDQTSIQLSTGSNSVQLTVLGHTDLDRLTIRIENRWDTLAQTQQWSACSPREQLRMLAADSGPLFEPQRQRVASELAGAMEQAESEFTTTLVAKELSEPRPTRVLRRGEYDLPIGDPLEPGILTVMSSFPIDAPRNRLGLARWLTSPEHPTVTRVLVNRIWQRTFGHALVRTPEDFGLQGQQPTHPRLLDWMAVELQESGWDLKRMLRAMVTSRTFRQNARWRSDVDDPENRLFARAASYRLDAEVLRDVGLWSSGLLDPAMGGEGVKPYQPPGMWQALAHPASNTKAYVPDTGRKLYRRSLYVYWKRTSPHPMMTLFDAPDRESSCVRRSRTNTPLQSLGMLNERQRVEMGRALAARLIGSHEDDDERISTMFRLLACRDSRHSERQACRELLAEMHQRFATDSQAAAELLRVGASSGSAVQDEAELAAWTQVAMTVLASDIAIMMY